MSSGQLRHRPVRQGWRRLPSRSVRRPAAAIVGGNPQGLLGGDDGTDRIRNIERLQFSDVTVAIDADGNMSVAPSMAGSSIRTTATLYAPFYNAVPFGKPIDHRDHTGGNVVDPTVTRESRQYADRQCRRHLGFRRDQAPARSKFQWQFNDILTGAWVDIGGATGATFKTHLVPDGQSGLRVETSYVDGKGSPKPLLCPDHGWSHWPVTCNTPPTVVAGTAVQRHSQHDRRCWASRSTTSRRSPRSSPMPRPPVECAGLQGGRGRGGRGRAAGHAWTCPSHFDPVTGAGEFKTLAAAPAEFSGTPMTTGSTPPAH